MLVCKYGGTSLGDTPRIRAAAANIKKIADSGEEVVMVVSAMGGETDRLAALCGEFGGGAPRERDRVLACGEEACSGLAAMALQQSGVAARSFTGAQAGITTDNAHGKARIVDIDTAPLRAALQAGETPVVAGFQGRAANGDISTLGRGGSDTTAVALAAALAADECRIYTDVRGVYTTDPRACKKARLLAAITFEEILEMASLGSKVLQIRAVEFAGKYRVPLRVLSAAEPDGAGTLIHYKANDMEKPAVTGVAFNRGEAKITIIGAPDKPGIAARILADVAAANINVDMIVQNIGSDGRTDFSFTVHREEYPQALRAAQKTADGIGAREAAGDANIGKVSAVGIGMKSHSGVAAKMFGVLAGENINIQMISTSEIKISVVIDENRLEDAVRALHDAFGLDKDPESE
ncbi:MAG: aspartate kinase [Gammaproteobacteria bacterium]